MEQAAPKPGGKVGNHDKDRDCEVEGVMQLGSCVYRWNYGVAAGKVQDLGTVQQERGIAGP